MIVGKRMKAVRKALNFSTKELAELFGMSQGNLSKIERGEQRVSVEILAHLHKQWNIDLTWLISGEGEMFINAPGGQSIEQIHQWIDSLPYEEKIWFRVEFLRRFPECRKFLELRE